MKVLNFTSGTTGAAWLPHLGHDQMKKLLLLPLLFAFTGVVQGSSNPLTFWWYAGDPTVLRPAIECALERIRAATCLPVDVSMDAHHWVRQKALGGGLAGQTTGASWDSTRIALLTGIDGNYACNVLVHEIAQHVLRRSNDHIQPASATQALHADLVAAVCDVQDCQCFNPE
jgi:hypothetical protein